MWINFTSTGIHTNVQRPVVLHAYGGAKAHMETAELTRDHHFFGTAPADLKGRLVAIVALAKALACSQGMRTRHVAQGY